MKLLRFFTSKTFWVNLLLILIALALIFWGLSFWLNSYTRHGDNLQVPNLSRLSYEEATEVAKSHKLKVSILDTAVFNPDFPRGSIIEQYPMAGAAVKEGREIKLTINRHKPRKIEMPVLLEKTKRRAIYDLESKGFTVGELKYVPYIGKDVVVEVRVNGQRIDQPARFEAGTVVDLVLGEGLSATRVKVPYLRFLTVSDARDKLLKASLNLGSVIYDEEVEDSSVALVYRQYPSPTREPAISMGADVDIWLTNDYNKIPNDSLQFLYPEIADSLAHDSTY